MLIPADRALMLHFLECAIDHIPLHGRCEETRRARRIEERFALAFDDQRAPVGVPLARLLAEAGRWWIDPRFTQPRIALGLPAAAS